MKRSLYMILVLTAVFALMLSACQTASPTTVPATQAQTAPTQPSAEVYPPAAANLEAESGYPASNSAYPDGIDESGIHSPYGIDGPLPTSTTGGTVQGKLLAGDPLTPLIMPFYLGEIIKDSAGQIRLAGVDKVSAPKAIFDREGNFVFINVPPGQYTLVLDVIASTLVLRNPANGEDIYIDVVESEISDLGVLEYPDLDVPRP